MDYRIMAMIKPFRGIRPASENTAPWDFLSAEAEKGSEQELLQGKLVPMGAATPVELWAAKDYLSELIAAGDYIQDPEMGLYVYQRFREGKNECGVFALTSLSGLDSGLAVNDEPIAPALAEQLENYDLHVGLEGSAALILHEPNAMIAELITRSLGSRHGYFYTTGNATHYFVRVTAISQIRDFQLAFATLGRMQLAGNRERPGHAIRQGSRQWLFSLYMSADQLPIGAVHRLVQPRSDREREKALARVREYFFVSQMPGNVPCRPAKKHRIGMYADGKWYQLDLRPELRMDSPLDAEFLQEKIISGIFGIRSPSKDGRLMCYSDSEWDRLVSAIDSHPGSVAFTLCAIGMEEMVRFAMAGEKLPAHAFCMGDVPPFGLLMHGGKNIGRRETE